MKKIIICTIALSILFVLAACVSHPVHVHYPTEESQDSESQVIELQDSEPQDSGSQDSEAQDNSPQNSAPSLPGKIAIITQESFTQSAHHSSNWVIALTEEHGPENVIIYTWPTHNHNVTATETEDMITKIAQNTEIGVLIIDPATYGTDHIVNILRQQRNDIFIAYIGYYTTTNPNANLILSIDTEEMTRRFPSNAMELGADTLIFFYDTMTWDDEVYVESYIHGMMREKSAEIGLAFVEVDIAGAIQCGSSFAMFMTETIPPLLEEHGTNIVLYGLDNERVFWDWRNNGFIYLPMYPSWYQLYPINLAVELSILDSRAPNIGIYDTPQLI
ncbi:MAG: DUF3798 domain-containing protein, partial [Defluviitaleaceae bacterium]|nr:DUF3798 domain-containing protein [Defluviitaleaceae bacterium]